MEKMNKIEFVKKCIPFADGFTIAIDENNPLNVPVIYIENNGFSKRYIVREKTFQNIIFPHFLTKTIEGINREFFYTRGKYRIRQDELGLQVFDGWGHMEISYGCSKSWNEAKQYAIEYVLRNSP